MDFLFFLTILSLYLPLVSGAVFTEFIYPNFTASNFKFVDASGAFLLSSNGAFKAAMFNPGAQQTRFYLCVIHVESNAIVWSANRDSSVSKSGSMILTTNGINIIEDGENGSSRWSTPRLQSSVSALHLTETGNLVLLDQSNASLWESFDYPTDTIVTGQRLQIDRVLSSSVSSDDLSTGDYKLALTASDAVLQWKNLTYWKLSMDTSAFVNSFYAVSFLAINQSGLYLFGQGGSSVVVQLNLPPSEFRIAKIDPSGQFTVISFSGATPKQDFAGPVDECRVPFICGKIGLCSQGVSAYNPVCTCPAGFRATSNNSTRCSPADSSYSLPVSCNSTDHGGDTLNSSSLSYLQLGHGVDYFANDFTLPAVYGVNLSQCQNLCSQDCTCLGVFYDNSSGSCYKLANALGSVMSRASSSRLGFVKAVTRSPPGSFDDFNNDDMGFPAIAEVLLPVSGVLLLLAIAIVVWRRYRQEEIRNVKAVYSSSPSSDDLEFSIPGLPLRFDYEQLEKATENFKTLIGTGGFGTVYKGMLPDKSLVAVKKITNLGVRGKQDFCTEIAVIGSIHHMNLVKLRGYCAQKRQWLLVYEYMNRGSLDKTLFGNGPVLEWQERVDIAVGAARGLAYLHSACEQKIIHCDVKPENILLHDHFQAKMSDFGLAKLINREESSLFTTMRGTRGYLAPEWLTSSAISDKTDVYSFGMVLLEIVSGRKNCVTRRSHSLDDQDSSSAGTTSPSSLGHELVYFPLYALEMHEQGRYLELVDPRLTGRVTSEDVEKLVRVALCCVHEEPALRPSMITVVGMLEGKVPTGAPRIEALNFLRFYGRRFAEASTVEESRGLSEVMVFQDANASQSSTRTMSTAGFSFISSQQISGPR